MLAFVSTTLANKEFVYDSREESIEQIANILSIYIGNLDRLPNSDTKLELLTNVDKSKLVLYNDLFILYLTNSYNKINSNDLVKISSWLNDQWSAYLNSI